MVLFSYAFFVKKRKYKGKIKSSREAAIKKFFQEILYGPVWECVCCRTLNFWHNVVVYDEKMKAQIRKKADEAFERYYNSKIKQVEAHQYTIQYEVSTSFWDLTRFFEISLDILRSNYFFEIHNIFLRSHKISL